MRIVAISDTHTHHREIQEMPAGDVLVHAGDFTSTGLEQEVKSFNDWLGELDYKHKLVIAGNHELAFEQLPMFDKVQLLSNARYLEGEAITIDGINFWGGPWTPEFCNWAFMAFRGNLYRYWRRIPDNTNVLITHGPPMDILDFAHYSKEHVGCEELLDRVQELEELRLHIFGHIHGNYGIEHYEYEESSMDYVNASTCTEMYRPSNLPTVIDI